MADPLKAFQEINTNLGEMDTRLGNIQKNWVDPPDPEKPTLLAALQDIQSSIHAMHGKVIALEKLVTPAPQ